jgi:anthranilate phosphoribosyltransferase
MIDEVIDEVEAGRDLATDNVVEALDQIMAGRTSEEQIGRLLLAWNRKGPAVDELVGVALAMRARMTPIATSRKNLIDTCGTGGDGLGTFNISTAAAIVTAAAGWPVAKHGNRAATSRTGSADALTALGVNVEAPLPVVERCLADLGICFCFAPLMHHAMKHVAAVRKRLGVPTIFNLVGPLANPAGAPHQVLGVGKTHLQPLLSKALVALGTKRSIVVMGSDGLDEVTLGGTTSVTEIEGKSSKSFTWSPADFGLEPIDLRCVVASNPAESAAMIEGVLRGESGPARSIVVANAAAAIWTAGAPYSPAGCAALIGECIDRGTARKLLAELGRMTK